MKKRRAGGKKAIKEIRKKFKKCHACKKKKPVGFKGGKALCRKCFEKFEISQLL